ncbi:hypothetical protein Hanom_Chr14g01263391 [Helianthus anomalus]
MKNSNVSLYPIFEVDESLFGKSGAHESRSDGLSVEREYDSLIPDVGLQGDQTLSPQAVKKDGDFVGPKEQHHNTGIDNGSILETTRPSYVTKRPKDVKKSKVRKTKSNKQKETVGAEAQVLDIPDLNMQVESDGDSDPFNINAIFRLEDEVARAGANKVIERDFLDNMEENQGEGPDNGRLQNGNGDRCGWIGESRVKFCL